MMALPTFVFMTKVGQAFTTRSLRGAQTDRSILNANSNCIMTNKGILIFMLIFFIGTSIFNYFVLYEQDLTRTLTTSIISSVLLLIFLIVKRNWNKRQETESK
ncbi:hypothetical protein DFQ11_102329 [Winogradskyella epiphytica]|uniref:Uncharacterized protein n=1 Tax=Winogradskyella epiphytica TaxID=262005 RepID=A0A2V4XFB9_9FLAO|nr:hypothetical protein DFQ11_102329 [Winogradskyella epiphytica]GGW62903.1 hypothetical protein GCM10008085_13400 [Winogradskyella epiphytica]